MGTIAADTSTASSFAFLSPYGPLYIRLATVAERALAVDPSLTLVSLRQLAEAFAKHAAARGSPAIVVMHLRRRSTSCDPHQRDPVGRAVERTLRSGVLETWRRRVGRSKPHVHARDQAREAVGSQLGGVVLLQDRQARRTRATGPGERVVRHERERRHRRALDLLARPRNVLSLLWVPDAVGARLGMP
jgi:hypothetical protein